MGMNIYPVCDLCGYESTAETFEEKIHYYSGRLNGDFNNHIHICTECVSVLKQHFKELSSPLQRHFMELDFDSLKRVVKDSTGNKLPHHIIAYPDDLLTGEETTKLKIATLNWVFTSSTGASSELLAKFFSLGHIDTNIDEYLDFHLDTDDFTRCMNYLTIIRLEIGNEKVKDILNYARRLHPAWHRLIDNWDILERRILEASCKPIKHFGSINSDITKLVKGEVVIL